MSYFALVYKVVPDFVTRRTTFRDQHLRLAREAHARGELLLAGALADPADGALLIFCCADKSTVENFARHDPYVVNGLVEEWTVRPWTVVVGQDAETPLSSTSRLQ
jgi:uncharacterized protein YciI